MEEDSAVAVKTMTLNNLEVAILELRGSFMGGEETDELKAEAADLFEQGNRKLVIDMSNVTYCNSMGIGALVGLHTMYSKDGGQIKLCAMGKGIKNVFVITKLISIFDVEEKREDAIHNFQAIEPVTN